MAIQGLHSLSLDALSLRCAEDTYVCVCACVFVRLFAANTQTHIGILQVVAALVAAQGSSCNKKTCEQKDILLLHFMI